MELISPRSPRRIEDNPNWSRVFLKIDPDRIYPNGIITLCFDNVTNGWRVAWKCDDAFFLLERRAKSLPTSKHFLASNYRMAIYRVECFKQYMARWGLKPIVHVEGDYAVKG